MILASITAPVINAIATFQRNAELVTFDDGVANILPTDFYHTDIIPWRAKLYRKLLGSSSLNRIKKRIVRHYTIFPQFKNIVEQDKIKNLIIFENKKGRQINAKPRVYFIGQPFKEVLKTAQQIKLERYIHTLTIDFYVKHPRERETLKINAPFLDKKGLIAEEAILQDSGESPIHLIGWFSSVMFSLNTAAQSKTIILFQESLELPYMSNLAQQAGCNVIVL